MEKEDKAKPVFEINIVNMFKQLHDIALEQSKTNGLVVSNLAFENGKGFESGEYLITVTLPKDSPEDASIEDGKNGYPSKEDAIGALQKYTEFFASPDAEKSVDDKSVSEITIRINSNDAKDQPAQDNKKDTDDKNEEAPVKENISFIDDVGTSIANLILLEADEDPKNSADPKAADKDPKDPKKPENNKAAQKRKTAVKGYSIQYTVKVGATKPKKMGSGIFGKFFKDKFGDLRKALSTITISSSAYGTIPVGKILDPDTIKNKVLMKPDIDANTVTSDIEKVFKQDFAGNSPVKVSLKTSKEAEALIKKAGAFKANYAKRLSGAKYSLVFEIDKDNDNAETASVDYVADACNKAFGRYMKMIDRNKVTGKDFIVVEDISPDKNDKTETPPTATDDKDSKTVKESFVLTVENMIVNELMQFDEEDKKELAKNEKDSDALNGKIKKVYNKFSAAVNSKLKSTLSNYEIRCGIYQSEEFVKYLQQEAVGDSELYNKIKDKNYVFATYLRNKDAKNAKKMLAPGKSSKDINEAELNEDKLFEADEPSLDDIKLTITKVVEEITAEFEDLFDKDEKSEPAAFEWSNDGNDEEDDEPAKVKESINFKSLANLIYESLLNEGHSEEQLAVDKEIERIGVENLTKNVDELRKNYLEYLKQVKSQNSKNEYVQKIEVNSKNWISKEFIGKLRDQEKASVDTIKTMLKDCVKRVGKTNDVKFELQALVDAMKKLPDGPKQDSDEESGEESDEKIKITFYDIDDPSKLESPEEPTDKDKEQYKTIGEPLELIPGEDVKIPEVGDKDKWKFFGFEPDPENMEESGDTYAIYMKDGKEITIKFINRDPNEQKPDKEIEQIKVEPGEVKDEDIPEPPKYAGYEFEKWDPDPNSLKDDGEVYTAYKDVENDNEDGPVKAHFIDVDPENPDDKSKEKQIGDVLTFEKPEDVKYPDPPDHKGWKFKSWSTPEKDLKDDIKNGEASGKIVIKTSYEKIGNSDMPFKIVLVPRTLKNNITVTFKTPGNPNDKKPKIETIGEPITGPAGEISKKAPQPPEYDGYEFEKWDPDPDTLGSDGETTAVYQPADGKDGSSGKAGHKAMYILPKDNIKYKSETVAKRRDLDGGVTDLEQNDAKIQ